MILLCSENQHIQYFLRKQSVLAKSGLRDVVQICLFSITPFIPKSTKGSLVPRLKTEIISAPLRYQDLQD